MPTPTEALRPKPRVVAPRTATPPAGAQPPAGAGGDNPFAAGGPPGSRGAGALSQVVVSGGGRAENLAEKAVAQQTAQQNVKGATPFMDTPGMQIAGNRISGQGVADDPAVAAAMADFQKRVAPGIQNRATMSGLGRSNAALNAVTEAQGQMLAPMYESAFGREQQRLSNLNTAAENELGRGERSAARVADANQNQTKMLMDMSNTMWNRQQTTGQNVMGAGGQFRDIAQEGFSAEINDFLRQQALGEQAVYAPFGGLASAGMGSKSSTTGK